MRRTVRNLSMAIPALALALTVFTACGGDDEETAAGGDGVAGSSSEDTSDLTPQQQQELDYYECLREQGVDVEDPDLNDQGMQLQVTPETEAAHEACKDLAPMGGEPPEASQEDLENIQNFVECLRAEGIDMADPNPDGSLSMPEGADPNSAEFQDAMATCQSELNGAPIRMGGPR
ncbi:hypothetical protein [Phytoactinopolyspora halotolerans]|uniref:Secreted protein n=1 Tax=Phytoactinopolyspora halotolerans TaxID=1981512 RepID=A0A6L9S5Y5_9ACTN|nr:hypothetical protein [Phytoactinopolyspora halotolerans]NEE00393.1 hypothetical protein [Phytoactinopolyspora halotolerans]